MAIEEKRLTTSSIADRLRKKAVWCVFLQTDLRHFILDWLDPLHEIPVADALLFHRPRKWWLPPTGLSIPPMPREQAQKLAWSRLNVPPSADIECKVVCLGRMNWHIWSNGRSMMVKNEAYIPRPDGLPTGAERRDLSPFEDGKLVLPIDVPTLFRHSFSRDSQKYNSIVMSMWRAIGKPGANLVFWHWKRLKCGPKPSWLRFDIFFFTCIDGKAAPVSLECALWNVEDYEVCRRLIDGKIGESTIKSYILEKRNSLKVFIPDYYLLAVGVLELKDIPPNPDNVFSALKVCPESAIPFLERGDCKSIEETDDWQTAVEDLDLEAYKILEKYHASELEGLNFFSFNSAIFDYIVFEKKVDASTIIDRLTGGDCWSNDDWAGDTENFISIHHKRLDPERLGKVVDFFLSMCFGPGRREEIEMTDERIEFIYEEMAGHDMLIPSSCYGHLGKEGIPLLRAGKKEEFYKLMGHSFPSEEVPQELQSDE